MEYAFNPDYACPDVKPLGAVIANYPFENQHVSIMLAKPGMMPVTLYQFRLHTPIATAFDVVLKAGQLDKATAEQTVTEFTQWLLDDGFILKEPDSSTVLNQLM